MGDECRGPLRPLLPLPPLHTLLNLPNLPNLPPLLNLPNLLPRRKALALALLAVIGRGRG
jgi:hypothetical protein